MGEVVGKGVLGGPPPLGGGLWVGPWGAGVWAAWGATFRRRLARMGGVGRWVGVLVGNKEVGAGGHSPPAHQGRRRQQVRDERGPHK